MTHVSRISIKINWNLFQLFIYFVGNRLTPLVRWFFARNLNCQVRKPFIRCGTVPVLDAPSALIMTSQTS